MHTETQKGRDDRELIDVELHKNGVKTSEELVTCGAGGKQDVASVRCISYMSLNEFVTFSFGQKLGVAHVTRPELNLQATGTRYSYTLQSSANTDLHA